MWLQYNIRVRNLFYDILHTNISLEEAIKTHEEYYKKLIKRLNEEYDACRHER